MSDDKDRESVITEEDVIEFYDPSKEHFTSQNKRNDFLRGLEDDRTSFTYSTIQ